MKNQALFGVAVLIAGGLVGWYVLRGTDALRESTQSTPSTEEASISPSPFDYSGDSSLESDTGQGSSMEKGGIPARTVITYSDSGFTPASVTVSVGTTVQFVNEAETGMWVASAVHPTHQLLPGFDELTSVGRGGTYEYTFGKVGTWKYHNHMAPTKTGVVIVRG